MTITHFTKLIIPRLKWFKESQIKLFREWRRLKTAREINLKAKELVEKQVELIRKNNENSLREAYGIQKQLEILNWLVEINK